jgi:hypothetical protein
MVNPVFDVLTKPQLLALRAMLVHQASLDELETAAYIETCKTLVAEIDEMMEHAEMYCSEV